jgi:hypothetical protein
MAPARPAWTSWSWGGECVEEGWSVTRSPPSTGQVRVEILVWVTADTWSGSPRRLDASTPRRLDAAFPVTGYRSTLTVHEVPRERETSRVEWSGVFTPAGRPSATRRPGALFRARAGTRPGRAWQVRCRARRSWCCPHQGRSVEINDMDVSSCSTSSTARRPATRWPRGPEGSTPSPPARTGWTPTRCSSGPTAVSPGPCPPGQDLDATTPVRAPGTWSGQPA